MIAQGQSSSTKRGGLAADVSSMLIFLKKKKRILLKIIFLKWKVKIVNEELVVLM